jgi:hypothetical protein
MNFEGFVCPQISDCGLWKEVEERSAAQAARIAVREM